MQFEEHPASHALNITAYQTDGIEINGITYTLPICLLDNECQICHQTHAHQLTVDTFRAQFATHQVPEIILVGTGNKHIFLHPKITAELAAHGIGLESMTTAAACRTFTLLQSEGRRVWAWLFG